MKDIAVFVLPFGLVFAVSTLGRYRLVPRGQRHKITNNKFIINKLHLVDLARSSSTRVPGLLSELEKRR